MIVHINNIVWDTDGKPVKLPTEGWFTGFANGHILTEDEVEGLIDELSKRYGYCVKSSNYTCYDSD